MRVQKQDPKHDPVMAKPLEVTPKPGESPERMIKRFTKKVRNEGILQELYNRRGFEKPSVKRRRKRLRAMFNKMAADRQVDAK